MLILSAEGSAINRYVLGSHPFIFIGKISYPLYLWHWVLFSFAGIALAAPPGRGDRVAIILAGVALAWLTYALVERPLRFGAGRRVKAILLCVAVTAIGGVGFVTVVAKGFDRLPAFLEDLSLIKMDPEKDWRRGKCFLEFGDDLSKFADSCIEKNCRPLVFLWGDSVAASLYPGLLNAQKTFDFGLGEFATAGCPPVIGFITHVRPYCKSNNDFVLSLIARNKPEIVLLDSAWEYGNPGIGIDLERIDDTISEIRKVAKSRIIMIGPPINWGAGLPQTTFAFAHDSHALIPERTRLNMKDTHDIERILKAKARDSGIEFISAWDAMCNADGCVSRVGPRAKDLTAFDSYHLTIAGARFLADAIMPRVLGGPGD